MIHQVRRFNRAVTQRIGALDDHYLSRDRPLGEARVLWEIGAAGDPGCDVRHLRSCLDLDSGYLSRLLRSLEAAGLVAVGPSTRDRRVRTARLTKAGKAERAVLDRRSDALARSLLEPLTDAQRARLVAATAEVERLLTAALVEIVDVDPADPDAQHCLQEYFTELAWRFDDGFDPALSRMADATEFRPPRGAFVVARLHGEPVGCGALKLRTGDPAEIKRMWVAGSARGLGLGRRLLRELEQRAAAAGARAVRLDTNSALVEAIAMYRSAGYREIAAFNDERYAHHWFEKRLPGVRSNANEPGRNPTMTSDLEVRHNPDRSRYELVEGDSVIGVADYRVLDGIVVFPHTEIEAARRGHGLGAVLVQGALDDVRASGRTVVPRCWYVAQFIDEHPQYDDLVA